MSEVLMLIFIVGGVRVVGPPINRRIQEYMITVRRSHLEKIRMLPKNQPPQLAE